MLAKRIIPCLDVTGGRVVKGVNFVELRDAGDPVEIAARYNDQGADELTFLDITATSDGRDLILHIIEAVAAQVFIPLTVGGGVRTVADVRRLLNAGADKLPVPDVEGLRPTPDRVRETLFNWLGQDLSGWHCLDAFAGSGALGFEAASRGAAEVLLLEREGRQAASLRQSQQRLKVDGLSVQQADAMSWLTARPLPRFDLIFLDPPFASGLHAPALQAVLPWLKPQGWVYLEAGAPLVLETQALCLRKQGRAGAVHFHLLQLN
ncbi:hypothetical protein B566_EDAN018087 [Ephemera danica]|nr:hypothetical protein B566_EDAN018087 [Ephemera danica]